MVAPDLVVTGNVQTLDPGRPSAAALLARAGRVLRIGTAAECRREARPGWIHLTTGSGCALPGLADAHGHLVLHARALEEVRCAGARDEQECATRAADAAVGLAPGAWLRGRGWDENRWTDRRLPTATSLSTAVPDRPAILERVDGHAAWVNARALELAGIGASTPDPAGGRILRDERGAPTGVLVDAAQDLVLAHVPRPSVDELARLAAAGARDLVRYGLTGIHDAGCGSSMLRAYDRVAEEDALPLRVYAMIDGGERDGELEAELARWAAVPFIGRLEVRAVKLFADGALGSRGAALIDGYHDHPDDRGLLLMDDATLRRRLLRVHRAGFQPAVHAIGDAACRQVLRAYASLGAEDPAFRDRRPRVEHLQFLRPEDGPLLRGSGAIASMQPIHAVSDAPIVPGRVGAGSATERGAYAWRTVLDLGVPLAFGSDFPVESPDPRLGLVAAEERRPDGAARPWMPEQRLTRLEALRAYTSGAAFAGFAEQKRGVLREGMDADLTVFGADLLRVNANELPAVPITATVVGGRVEFVAA